MVALKIWRVRHENQGCERKEGETEKDCRCQTIGQEAKCAVSVGRVTKMISTVLKGGHLWPPEPTLCVVRT
jgi:hypothetical protein